MAHFVDILGYSSQIDAVRKQINIFVIHFPFSTTSATAATKTDSSASEGGANDIIEKGAGSAKSGNSRAKGITGSRANDPVGIVLLRHVRNGNGE